LETVLWILLILLLGLLLFLRKHYSDRERTLKQTQAKQMEAFRSSLFTSLTRDLRTPLTVLSGAADQLWAKTNGSSSELQLIQSNTERLLHLMNRLQDQSRLEAGQLKLDLEQSDIIDHLRQLLTSWRFQAADQGITLDFQPAQAHFNMDFDRVRLIYIVSTLLGTAFRQTPRGGRITLKTQIEQRENEGKELLITVLNSPSAGIDQHANLDWTFIEDLVALMGGRLQETREDAGQTHRQMLRLPVTRQAPKKEPVLSPPARTTPDFVAKAETIMEHEDAPLILIAEDNPDLVSLLSQILGYEHNLIIARNGQQGIDLALQHVPDIVVTDVMMPLKDGYELCYTLKNHELTSHIPIIMMSAKTGMDSRMTGLRQGADVYLEKPFQPDELEAIVETMLEQRRRLQAYYQSISGVTEEEITKPASNLPDQKENEFLQKVRQAVEEHLEQEDFSVEQLSQFLFMDSSNLYRKVKALTGLSPVQYIQSLRLRQAKKLLRESDNPITSIALDCGFNSSGYFSRVFKKDTGLTPSQYRKQQK
jgi:AraC-like DNA-binding protein/AmiR/NasT family two-component response regulator